MIVRYGGIYAGTGSVPIFYEKQCVYGLPLMGDAQPLIYIPMMKLQALWREMSMQRSNQGYGVSFAPQLGAKLILHGEP